MTAKKIERQRPERSGGASSTSLHAKRAPPRSRRARLNKWQDADDLRWAVRHWATRLGVQAPRIHLRPMKSKWASISTAGRLTLNTDLLSIPKDLGEFVVVHELVHLLAPNHGKVFRSFMQAYLPDWEARAERLAETKQGQ